MAKNWFEHLCRNTGLMFHNVAHPDGQAPGAKKVVRQSVEEKQVSPTTVVRRTVVEEIEIRGEPKP
ncbi:MAG: hypothetical protein NTW19_16445 [Planctomycetota bacterium]|nr:hypothetical protein [Planctomycetota bacterium]